MSFCPLIALAVASAIPAATTFLAHAAWRCNNARAADQAQIVEFITGIGGIIGSVLAIYGRIVATKKIT